MSADPPLGDISVPPSLVNAEPGGGDRREHAAQIRREHWSAFRKLLGDDGRGYLMLLEVARSLRARRDESTETLERERLDLEWLRRLEHKIHARLHRLGPEALIQPSLPFPVENRRTDEWSDDELERVSAPVPEEFRDEGGRPWQFDEEVPYFSVCSPHGDELMRFGPSTTWLQAAAEVYDWLQGATAAVTLWGSRDAQARFRLAVLDRVLWHFETDGGTPRWEDALPGRPGDDGEDGARPTVNSSESRTFDAATVALVDTAYFQAYVQDVRECGSAGGTATPTWPAAYADALDELGDSPYNTFDSFWSAYKQGRARRKIARQKFGRGPDLRVRQWPLPD